MTTLFSELDSNDVANVKNQYETYGRQRAVQYVRQYCAGNSIYRARYIVDTLQQENGWYSWSEEPRQTRRKRKFVERATRLIQNMGGKVEGVDTEKLRKHEVTQVKDFVRNNIDQIELGDLSSIIKTFSRR